MIKEPRLRFTEEERADPALEKPIRKAEKAAVKADKAQAKIPKKQVKRAEVDPKTGKVTTKLVEILCAAKVQRGQAGETVLEGTEVQILADVVAQLYACLTECRFVGPLGLAAYAELSSMAASLMLGEWFD